jgi:hypothetical protein
LNKNTCLEIQSKAANLHEAQHNFPSLGCRKPPREIYFFGILIRDETDCPQIPQQGIVFGECQNFNEVEMS